MNIRIANVNDAEAIRKIYAPYVLETAVSFEYHVPTIEEFKNRIQNTLVKYPYLVLEDNGEIVGYAYAGTFHNTREAYRHSVELSIYIDQKCRKKGYGKLLYFKLQELLLKQNIYSVHACIASPDGEDSHLTKDSELFHSRMGFELVGKHYKCGYKFGKWYSVIWMDKNLVENPTEPEEFIPFSKLGDA